MEKSRESSIILVHFLRNVVKLAWFFNVPNDLWLQNFHKWNQKRSDPTVVQAAAKASPWGFNPIPLPMKQKKEAEQSKAVAKAKSEALAVPASVARPPPPPIPSSTAKAPPVAPPAAAATTAIIEPPPPPTRAPPAAKASVIVPKALPPAVPKVKAPPPELMAKLVAKKFDWSNKMVFANDLLERYPEFKTWNVDESTLTSCSKTLTYFMRHAVEKYNIQSHKVADMEGWFSFDDIRERVDRHLRRVEFTARRLLYTVAMNNGQRFELYVHGPDVDLKDPATKVYIRPTAGQSEIYDSAGKPIKNPDRLYNASMRLRLEDLKVAG